MPYVRTGRRAGAPNGNRNALRHGAYTLEARLDYAYAQALLGAVRSPGRAMPALGRPVAPAEPARMGGGRERGEEFPRSNPTGGGSVITSNVIEAGPPRRDDPDMTAIHTHDGQSGFGSLLRSWRQTRRLSQLDLALACGASQRHVSFMESGRARPSRGMALTLGSVLRVPLKDQNLMLLAAGHAPAFAEPGRRPAKGPAIDAQLIRVLRQQDPLPAMLLESNYRIAAANDGAERLMTFLIGAPRANDDLAALFFGEGGFVRHLENADEVIAWTERQQRAQRILNLSPGESMVAAPAAHARREPIAPDGPALTLRFNKDGIRIALYTLLATLGTPLDIGAERLSLEFFVPADEESEAWFRSAA